VIHLILTHEINQLLGALDNAREDASGNHSSSESMVDD